LTVQEQSKVRLRENGMTATPAQELLEDDPRMSALALLVVVGLVLYGLRHHA
jgi:hypothetical protein